MLLIYLAIAVAGLVVAYFIKMTWFPLKTAVHSQVTAKVTPIPTPVGWKLYTNSDYKLSFAYPPTDTIKPSTYGFGVASIALATTDGTTDFQLLFLPKSLAQMVGQDFDIYYALPDNTPKVIKNPLAKDNETETFTKIHNRSVAGLRALDYQSVASNAKPGSPPEIGTFIETGSNLVLISTGESNKGALESLLSTFKYPL